MCGHAMGHTRASGVQFHRSYLFVALAEQGLQTVGLWEGRERGGERGRETGGEGDGGEMGGERDGG